MATKAQKHKAMMAAWAQSGTPDTVLVLSFTKRDVIEGYMAGYLNDKIVEQFDMYKGNESIEVEYSKDETGEITARTTIYKSKTQS